MILAGILLGFVVGLLFFVVIASGQHLSGWLDQTKDTPLPCPSDGAPWEELAERAEKAVETAQAELPPDIRAQALGLATLFQEWHLTRQRVLGVYYDNGPLGMEGRKGPLVLYLRAIETYSRRRRMAFEDQVRATYLHELGHHVGWNEGQVRERGL